MAPLYDEDGEVLFVAGEEVAAGRYVRVHVSVPREVILETAGLLPASHDGHVAVYRRLEKSWHSTLPIALWGDEESVATL